MFERPTRHPSLDDIRGYGRGGGGQSRSRRAYEQQFYAAESPPEVKGKSISLHANGELQLRLPPLNSNSNLAQQTRLLLSNMTRAQREAALDPNKCLHPQSRICENLRFIISFISNCTHQINNEWPISDTICTD